MNRIARLTECFDLSPDNWSPDKLPARIEQGRYTLDSPECRAVFTPLHYERNYAYPLIVWLHGPGDDERQLQRIMPLVSMRNYVAVGPRGTVEVRAATPVEMPAANRSVFGGYEWSQRKDHILLAEHRVMEAIDAACEKFNIEPTRIFLAGFACGGTMALRVALNHPDRVAGVLSLGGAFPTGQTPLKRLAEVRRLRLLLATGRDSRGYPAKQVCADLRLMYSAGMSVCLRQYPCGDELTTLMLADMDRWIMDQLTSAVTVRSDREQAPRT
jgi:phospholipase/carboxylesterase